MVSRSPTFIERFYGDEVLTDPALPVWLAEHGIRLVHFGELGIDPGPTEPGPDAAGNG